jgi:hypothetical protein
LRPAPRASSKRCGDGVESSICVPCILTVSDGIVSRDRAAKYSTLEAAIDDVSFASQILLGHHHWRRSSSRHRSLAPRAQRSPQRAPAPAQYSRSSTAGCASLGGFCTVLLYFCRLEIRTVTRFEQGGSLGACLLELWSESGRAVH